MQEDEDEVEEENQDSAETDYISGDKSSDGKGDGFHFCEPKAALK